MNHALQQPALEVNDEFDAFGRYMALGLKKMPIHVAIQCQNELQATLTRYRLIAITTSPVTIHIPSPTPSPISTGSNTSFTDPGSDPLTGSSTLEEVPEYEYSFLVNEALSDE